MANAHTLIRCTCCQAELTMPQFYNGRPYGYTCITKVSKQKRTKVAYVAVEYTVLQGAGTSRQVVKVSTHGQTKAVVFYVSADSDTLTIEGGKVSGAYYQNGTLFVSEEMLKKYGFDLKPAPAPVEQGKDKAPSAIELLMMEALKG